MAVILFCAQSKPFEWLAREDLKTLVMFWLCKTNKVYCPRRGKVLNVIIVAQERT